jgi:hypothetical protein
MSGTHAALVQVALDAAQRTVRVERVRVDAAFLVRAVVAGDEDQRVLGDAEGLEAVHDPADHGVESRDLGRVLLVCGGPGLAGVLVGVRDVRGGVRKGGGEEQQEGLGRVRVDEVQRSLLHQVGRVRAHGTVRVLRDVDLLAVVPQVRRVVLVSMAVVDVAVELLEASCVGMAGLVRQVRPEAPLADAGRAVAAGPQHLRERGVALHE